MVIYDLAVYETLAGYLFQPFIDIQPELPGKIFRNIIACICMADDTKARIITQYTAKPGSGSRCAIGYYNHSRVDTVPHAYSATVMKANPTCSAGCIHQSI